MSSQSAFSFLEILLSLLVLTFGLLGLAKLEIAAHRYNRSAYYASLADAHLASVINCLRITASSSYCKQHFKIMISQQLPLGQLAVRLTKNDYQVAVGWQEPHLRRTKKICTAYFSSSCNCLVAAGKS